MRWYVVDRFETELSIILREKSLSIAVIGGNESDAEVKIIDKLSPKSEITYFGIEDDRRINPLDLNNESIPLPAYEFDLVLCSQVIEHIWNTSHFFRILSSFVKDNGYLWISCPFSNIAHGSPDFFSTGYSPEYIVNNFTSEKFELILAEQVGSRRYYLATHLYATWLSQAEHLKPLFRYQFKPGTFKGVLWKFVRDLPGRIHLSLLSNKITHEDRWATETLVLLRKRKTND